MYSTKQKIRLYHLLSGGEHVKERRRALSNQRWSRDGRPGSPKRRIFAHLVERLRCEYAEAAREGVRTVDRMYQERDNRDACTAFSSVTYKVISFNSSTDIWRGRIPPDPEGNLETTCACAFVRYWVFTSKHPPTPTRMGPGQSLLMEVPTDYGPACR